MHLSFLGDGPRCAREPKAKNEMHAADSTYNRSVPGVVVTNQRNRGKSSEVCRSISFSNTLRTEREPGRIAAHREYPERSTGKCHHTDPIWRAFPKWKRGTGSRTPNQCAGVFGLFGTKVRRPTATGREFDRQLGRARHDLYDALIIVRPTVCIDAVTEFFEPEIPRR